MIVILTEDTVDIFEKIIKYLHSKIVILTGEKC